MEPGEYVTNVLSCSNFTSINYEYFEVQAHPPVAARKHLLRQEIAWRQEGRLVHCDPFKDGIWVFSAPAKSLTSSATTNESLCLIEGNGIRLVPGEKGTYVPANLVRNKQIGAHSLTAPSNNSSPPSSQESGAKTTLGLNARAFHQNASQSSVYEPPTPSPVSRPAAGANESAPSQRDLHEYFISAVLSSTVFHLCHSSGFIPLNSRTLISPSSKISNPSTLASKGLSSEVVLATLDISLTPMGSLVFKAHSDVAPGLQSLVASTGVQNSIVRLSQGASLWLAPGGTAAKYYGLPGDKTPPGAQPVANAQGNLSHGRSTSLSPTSMHAWQSKCLQWLSAKGLDTSTLEAGGWVLVQVFGSSPAYTSAENQGIPILDDLTVVPWPALLCFQTPTVPISEMQTSDANLMGNRDPLSFAEQWFTERDDRATTLLKRQKDRQAAEALSREQADVEARALPPNPYSPTTLRRSSNAGAVYPTPPDVLHHPIGATPTFDGMASTPSNPSTLPQHDGAASTATNPPVPDVDTDMWESSEGKERSTSGGNYNNNDSNNDNENDNDNDNLFGDVEVGDIFGTDITDADFSFFDEPDAIPLLEKAASSPLMNVTSDQGSLPLDDTFVLTSDPNLDEVVDIEMQHQNDETHADEEEKMIVPLTTDPAPPKYLQVPGSFDAIKTPQPLASPPFNKESVFNRLFQNSQDSMFSPSSRRASLFNKIDFEKSLLSVNQKYGSNGQYKFSSQAQRPKSLQFSELPETDFLVRRRQKTDHRQDSKISQLLRESIASPVHTTDPMDYLMESDGGSQISEQDDTSNTTDSQQFPSDSKNMQPLDGERDATSLPFDALVMDFEQVAHTPRSINGFQMPYLDADPADWSLTNYFSLPEPDIQSNTLSDYERIAIAQIIADQAVSGNLRLPSSSGQEMSQRFNRFSVTKELTQNLEKAIKVCLEDVATCNLRAYLEIQGVPVLNQALRLPPRPNLPPRGLNAMEATKPNNPFNIPPPQLELRRSDTKLSVLPSAAAFWENLGLSPSMGSKGVDAVCVFPNIEGVSLFASAFLDQMRSVYESLRLGTHDKIVDNELNDGSLSFTVDTSEQNKGHQLSALKETAGRLSRILSSHQAEEKNFVVYFVYPVDDTALLINICSSFQHLFNLYRKSLLDKKLTATNELVLQLVPMDFIATASSLVIQPPEEYARLAMEVYDRCTNFSSSTSSPAIMLEQPLPRSIDFKLSATPSASLLQENTCLHIAYARSIDDRWITAAWTDNRGTQQMTASYCLGRKNEAISMPFSDVANEIWETTLDYVSSKKIHWRIMIVRVGVMEPSELETWTSLTTAKANTQITLTLVTVQTDPSLRLLPKSATLPLNGFTAQNVVTPVSTPTPSQTAIFSPDSASTPTKESQNTSTTAEPSNDTDSDARLLDYTDQTWGAVLSHRLNNSNSLLDVNPALISGYLIKRGGTSVHDPPIVIEVNIVYSEVAGNPRTFHESLLREILVYYRGLAALARVRGVVDQVRDGRPWHIAAAEKAVKALYMLM